MFHSRLRKAAFSPPDGTMPPTFDPEGLSRPGDLSRLVREALAKHRIRMAFQPVRVVGSLGNAALHEGFVRILDAAGHLIPAGRFMGAVEESTLGRDLDCAALRLGLEALRAHPALRLALNASARSLGNSVWRATLDEAVRDVGGRLTLEVGEGSATLLPDRVSRFMTELRPRGVCFVLDDYGSRPLSLRQLRDFRFDGVKIDRSFVRGVERSADDQALVGALISVAHRFGMFAIAKGVETEGQAAQLRALGVDGLQGFLYGRPGPVP
jgi:EAL domain-containing protein (putative c-di-GMP-specific phosphodiesterase class I)